MPLIHPIIAVDTSAGSTSVALWNGEAVHTLVENEPNKQAEQLVIMMQTLLSEHAITCEQLAAYATTLGPGSFTGIRIGLSALIGMQTVFPRPLYGLNTLEVAAFQGGLSEGGMVARDAQRGQAYVQKFGANYQPEADPMLLDYEDALLYATGRTVLSNCPIIPGLPLPDVTAEGIIGLLRQRETAPLQKHDQRPLYIRPPDAKLPGAAVC